MYVKPWRWRPTFHTALCVEYNTVVKISAEAVEYLNNEPLYKFVVLH